MEPNVKEAIQWLQTAIARHERHMNGTEATSKASQMQMMVEMKNAMAALEGKPAGGKVTMRAGTVRINVMVKNAN